jgi:hypothetical protein
MKNLFPTKRRTSQILFSDGAQVQQYNGLKMQEKEQSLRKGVRLPFEGCVCMKVENSALCCTSLHWSCYDDLHEPAVERS